MNMERNEEEGILSIKICDFFNTYISESGPAGVFIERNIISRSTNKCHITHMHKELSHMCAYTVHISFKFQYVIAIFQNYCLL